jgi:hypothetical protein
MHVAVRAVRLGAVLLAAVLGVLAPVAVVPEDAVILEGNEVGCNTVQKPAVVADDQDAAGKLVYGLLESAAADRFFFGETRDSVVWLYILAGIPARLPVPLHLNRFP